MKAVSRRGTSFDMNFTRASWALLLLAACFQPAGDIVVDAGAGGGSGGGSAPLGGGSTPNMDGGAADAGDTITYCATLPGPGSNVCVAVPERVTCGGQLCELGEDCCFPTLKCVAPDAGTCVSPAPGLCASNFDCAEGEVCHRGGGSCDSLGSCTPRGEQCGTSGGGRFCGCDGHTYESAQEACVAGANIVGGVGECGVPDFFGNIPCGLDSQCPEGQACCGITGYCINAAQPWRCERQPGSGVIFNCESDEECRQANAGGGPGSDTYCAREGCAVSGHGSCTLPPNSGSCGGQIEQVCGCNGVTYVNECWARAAGTNIASSGACP